MIKLIHDVFIQYGFLSSQTNPPNFTVTDYNTNESIPIDYWHTYKNYVIHINKYQNKGEPEKECYMVFDRDGRVIKDLYNPYDSTYFFGYDTEFNSQVSPAPVNNYPSQNPPQYNSSNSVQVLPPAPVNIYPSQNSQPQPLHYRSLIQNTPNYSQHPQPEFDINHFLNAMPSKNYLNLESIIPSSHIIHRMASYLHKEFPLPMSTLILVGLGVASGMTARKWNCAYQKRGTKPICLYVVAEQEIGKGKTVALTTFQEPLRNIINNRIKKIISIIQTQKENLDAHLEKEADDLSKQYKAKFKLTKNKLEKDLALSEEKLENTHRLLAKKEVTPQALEESLNYTNGFFLAVSDEQNLIDSLISSKGKKSNGILLAGRNGEDFYSELRTRRGYNGKVTGSFICFSQYGCIDKIIRSSNGTGLCERFLMISEPELPERFHREDVSNTNDNSQDLLDEYANKFEFLNDIIQKPLDYDELTTLKISDNGWNEIKRFENHLKFHKLNGNLSHDILSGMASKADIQIMSIASNLYVLDLENYKNDNCIPDVYIGIAINIFRGLMNGVLNYCEANGIIGNKEKIEAIMNCFYDKNKSQYVSLNPEQIKHKCEQLKVFKDLKNKRLIIVDLVNDLNKNNIILFDNGMYYINPLTQQPSHMMINRNI
jgi:hypothetical protein